MVEQESETDFALVRREYDQLDLFFSKSDYQRIEVANFPKLPPLNVISARFWAMDNVIDGFQNMRHAAIDEKLQKTLGVLINDLICQRDKKATLDFETYFKLDGAVDEKLIARQVMFRQSGDLSRLLDMTLGLGLMDKINGKNFPALRSLSENDLLELKLRSVEIRLDRLRGRLQQLSVIDGANQKVGFYSKDQAGSITAQLKEEITQWEKCYLNLLEGYREKPLSEPTP